jgi:hypothetical protein
VPLVALQILFYDLLVDLRLAGLFGEPLGGGQILSVEVRASKFPNLLKSLGNV